MALDKSSQKKIVSHLRKARFEIANTLFERIGDLDTWHNLTNEWSMNKETDYRQCDFDSSFIHHELYRVRR